MGGGFRLDKRQRSSDNLRALFSIFSGYRASCEQKKTKEETLFVNGIVTVGAV